MTTASAVPTVAILGASGLIGFALAQGLSDQGFAVRAIARHFSTSQAGILGDQAVVSQITTLDATELAALLAGVDVLINCIGVLQDGPRGGTQDVHVAFVERLLATIAALPRRVFLIHVSVPGRPEDDGTPFSRTKRDAERLIAGRDLPHAILRPGFVIAPVAYGGSALLRGLAAWPLSLPARVASRPFAITAIDDLTRTVIFAADAWQAGHRSWRATWEVGTPPGPTVGSVVAEFRRRIGGPVPRLTVPDWLMAAGARAGDMAAFLGWAPPIRTTALREMERGVVCDPASWIAATRLTPTSLEAAAAAVPGSVQERWFSRLFLLKWLIVGVLALFWIVSGLIALTVAFRPAAAILVAHGFAIGWADGINAMSSLVDIAIGSAIAVRRTCRSGLWAGAAVSLFYMAAAALFTPDMWAEPLGALVKTGPAIVLMLVALAILDDR